MMTPAYLSCLVILLAFPLTQQQLVRPSFGPEIDTYECEDLTTIELCANIYDRASFPNYREHPDQVSANNELLNFLPLIQSPCSNAIVHFLCSIYAPFCKVGRENIRIRPCRELCDHVRSTCEQPLREYNLDWPPHLECSNFRLDAETELDFCPDDIPNLPFPPNITTIAPPPTDTTSSTALTPGTPASSTGPTTPVTVTRPTGVTVPGMGTGIGASPTPAINNCPVNLRVTSNLVNKSYEFGGNGDCGMNCAGIYFTQAQSSIIAPVFILLFAVVCVLFTLFAVATFLIDRHRFHYPERPIIFISFCYLVVSLVYMVGAISKLSGSNNEAFSCSGENPESMKSTSFILQRLPNSESTYKSASCIILFVVVYFFHMASAIWWIVLTLTWFLAAALKWGEEAVEKLWLLYHILAWGIPAVQVILVLALRLVDGDQLSGLCYTGNSNSVGLGVFVFLPLTFYLLIGVIFLVIGFTALVNIRRQLQRDAAKAKKIGRLIMRVGLYSALYISFYTVLLILFLYELARKQEWEAAYVRDCGNVGLEEECTAGSTPSFAAFLIKYITIFCIGIGSTSWIFSSKTFAAWQKLFCQCCATSGDLYNPPVEHQYDVPNPQRYVMPEKYGIPPEKHNIIPEKHGDLSSLQYHPHPHTAV